MNNSAERIQFIVDNLICYRQKIEFLNKHGLFDAAALYEVFAIEICSMLFSQKFENLNKQKANFPYFDLLSEDHRIYIQVTTNQDIPGKIKKTLDKLRDNSSELFSSITCLYFFVLDNESLKKVNVSNEQVSVGNLTFKTTDNLITLGTILNKAKTDINFQIELYELLKKETNAYSYNEKKLEEMISDSKVHIASNIDYLINKEYEIDRSEIISRIKKENKRFISVQGEAGTGKSALCKKLLEEEDLVLYARAERFLEEADLSCVWNIDVRSTLKYLNGKKITFFIDALEFIADSKKATKIDLLQELYDIARQYNNVYIVTTCRTYDYTSFLKIHSSYKIEIYELPKLNNNEILEISQNYPIIKQIFELKPYECLLRTPFYIDLIVRQVSSVDTINDVNELRDYIWNNVICLGNRFLPGDISNTKIKKTIMNIVFQRAKSFLLGISSDTFDNDVIALLLSANVLVESKNKVRLKYDIYEDICFERYFDEQFELCKGDYTAFFMTIESLGRCVYRRYQIWIENKLFAKSNRDKFLYHLVADKIALPPTWEQQTIIGIVKSRFCEQFFIDYKESLIENKFKEFISNTNMYSFEPIILTLDSGNAVTMLQPIGQGRNCLIRLLQETDKYKEETERSKIFKLCSDYAKSKHFDPETAKGACIILEYFIDETMKTIDNTNQYNQEALINNYLQPLYLMAEFAKDWIREFWQKTINIYHQNNQSHRILAKEILQYVLKHTTQSLVQFLSPELCNLANHYWIYSSKETICNLETDYHEKSQYYSLSENSDYYTTEFSTPNMNQFFLMLIRFNLNAALNWAIDLTNHVASAFAQQFPESISEIELWFDEDNYNKKFISHPDFWVVDIDEYRVHTLISDIINLLGSYINQLISSIATDNLLVQRFANHIKKSIYANANNIMMLTIIERIGFQYFEELPGYSLDLVSSIDLVMLDIQRYGLLYPNPLRMRLEEQLYRSVGLPRLQKRYERNDKLTSLQQYMFSVQLFCDTEIRAHAERILDYLYRLIPNDKEHAELHLQIQKMDSRNTETERVSENTILISPKLSGAAKKLHLESNHTQDNHVKNEINRILETFSKIINSEGDHNQECLASLSQIENAMSASSMPFLYENEWITMIAAILAKRDLDVTNRSRLCKKWIDEIEKILANKSFNFDLQLSIVLFKQIEYVLETKTINQLKLLMLTCLQNHGENGNINRIRNILKQYLSENSHLAKLLFNTISALAEDKMNHYRFCLNFRNLQEKDELIQRQNKNDYIYWTEQFMKKNGYACYQSNEVSLIQKYLFDEVPFDFSDFNIDNFDLDTLSYVASSGLKLDSPICFNILQAILQKFIDKWKSTYYHTIDVYSVSELSDFLKREILYSEDITKVLEFLFNNVDYSQFKSNTFDFYEDIISSVITVYFDAYKSTTKRNHLAKKIKAIERSIDSIQNSRIKSELSKGLFLSTRSFTGIDGNSFQTSYTYVDKQFLNEIWIKYGSKHLDGLLYVIYNMHIEALLPEILVSIAHCFSEAARVPRYLQKIVEDENMNIIINEIITIAFVSYNEEIKQDEEIVNSFETLLNCLIEVGSTEAATILDEFRIH